MDVALTFDDGPGAVTGPLLDVLARHGARATFFCVGELIAGREAELARAAREGHELAVHGWVHEDHRDDPARRAEDAARTADAVTAASSSRPRLFRPPYGYTSPELEAAIEARGLRTVLLHERPDTVGAVDLLLGDGWRSVLVS